MQVSRYDIFRARVQFGKSTDPRPCIVLRGPTPDPDNVRAPVVLLAPLSSQMDLYEPANHFLLDKREADFEATGLSRSSYIITTVPAHVAVSNLGKRLGALQGDLLARFLSWLPQTPPADTPPTR